VHKSHKRIYAVIFILLLVAACSSPKEGPEDYSMCSSCHTGIEAISTNHQFDCKTCHLTPQNRAKHPLRSHDIVVRNPSDPAYVTLFCGRCHEKEIERVKRSLHATMAGIINQTRFLWGAQKSASPPIYSANATLKPLPEPSSYPDNTKKLVDDFLRRKCLRCHIATTGASSPGLYRASGCAACHVVYNNDGRYVGKDPSIDKTKSGYPARHTFTAVIPNYQCLHCHNQNHVGADYEGFFEHDHDRFYRSPIINGSLPARPYGIDHHRLAKDIHSEKGLWCIDCHTRDDIMGDGNIYAHELDVPMRTCGDCHGSYDSGTPNSSVKAVRLETDQEARATAEGGPTAISTEDNSTQGKNIGGRREAVSLTPSSKVFLKSGSDKYYFQSKTGQKHALKPFSKETPSHNPEWHSRIRCSACHAQWSYQDYGLSVIRQDAGDLSRWRRLTVQGDPYLEKNLERNLKNPGQGPPVSKDWLTGKPKPGIWLVGWRFRRWEFMPLGLDHKNQYAILRPLYQYMISYVDRWEGVVLDSVIPERGDGKGKGWAFMPYVPHTISPKGRKCDACHLNKTAAGLGIFEQGTMDTELTIPSPPAVSSMRLLSEKEQKDLLSYSEAFQAGWFLEQTGTTTR